VSGVTGPSTFELTNLASTPHALTAGAGASQSAPVDTAFAVPLAVTVEDVNENPVPGAVVTFQAPASGASGTFAGSRSTATATTDSNGIAVAPKYLRGSNTMLP
jgi:hypothetical protein